MKPLDPRLLRHAGAARPFILGCAALGVATAGLVLVQADLLATSISRAFLGGAGIAALAIPVALLALVVLGRSLVSWLAETSAHRASAAVLSQLRAAVVEHTLRIGPTRQAGRSPAELATLATRGVDRLDGYFARYLPTLLVAAVVPAVVGARILLSDWVSAIIVGVTVPLIPIFMILIGLYTQRETAKQWRTLSVLGNHFLDLVAGLAVLTAFGRARAQLRGLRAITRTYRLQTMRTLRVAFLSALALELLATLSVALVAVSIGLRLVNGEMDLHTALVVLILAPEVYLPLRAVGTRFHDSAEGVAAANEIFGLLEEKPVAQGLRSPAPDPSVVPLRVRGVTVHGRSGPVLDSFDLRVEPGEVVGITGASGAGKSTLLDLLLGWYPPDAGAVFVDGVDLAELDRTAWQQRIAWVPQRPRLLTGSVAENIRLGKPGAPLSEVEAAAQAAGLDIPLDTHVGELGAGLSTGQQRRVALARALLLDRPLLLLDEPTEGVDADTEAEILRCLPAALAGRTAVIVTHREAVLDVCDRVVALPAPSPVAVPEVAPVSAAPQEDSEEDGRGWLSSVIRPHRWRLALACIAGALALGSGVALTATSAWLISTAALHPPILTLTVAIVAVRTFGIAKGVLRYVERLLSHDVALRALAELRVRVWSTLVRLGPALTERLRRGDLLQRMVSDVDAQQDLLVRVLVPGVSAAVVAAAASITVGALLPEAGVLLLVGLLCAGVLAPAMSAFAARRAERDTTGLRAEVTSGTVEVLEAAPDLIAYGAAAGRHTSLRETDTVLTSALRRSARARGLGAGTGTLSLGATMIGSLLLGIAALRAGRLPGPELAVLALTPLAAAELVAALPEAAQRFLSARHSARRLSELDHTVSPATEPSSPVSLSRPSSLTVTDLAVRWPGAARDAVSGVDFRVGNSVLLTGPSGAGKSTTLAAVMRYLDPSAGSVHLDSTDTRTCAGDEVRAELGWCGPDTHLFDTTLRENLMLARPSASDPELLNALSRARLRSWFASLPQGLDTPLGAHGTAVSGGERQRLGVARALLADRPILLLDEPTAHLDAPTAAALAEDVAAVAATRPTVVVTHRPAEFPSLPEVRVPRAASPDGVPSPTGSPTGAGRGTPHP
ncbi:thiol reductant ABC exporter subunit CydD [Amycolatopsis alkalitolerans]|uniref:Thiol reductant ABC exporter subunit CydD n=1 Tax=Amycolatopsis alkalitolerans TaxID=2547244 RepID=A0A5C4M1K5_9PSEU|nr:thiol reductant ABC exporter subunit CydD [Amycolatopsis alkalitolerans]TNC24804.1 thiol reductant ABC exporter subunit CydD [Amycolatopsis alkalitolerans]